MAPSFLKIFSGTLTQVTSAAILCIVSSCCLGQTLSDTMALFDEGKNQAAVTQLSAMAQRGDAEAQNMLGVLYDNGQQGIAQDYKLARTWFEKAAAQGQSSAQYHLGFLYEAGRGVPHSDKQALHWYGLAAAGGNPNAQYRLGLMQLNGFGVKANPAEARKWFALAAAQGDPQAQRQLGTLYARGLGVAQNKLLGYMWLDIARGLGDPSAERTGLELAQTMPPEAVSKAQVLAKQCIAKGYQGCEPSAR